MIITQSYARPSVAVSTPEGMRFAMAAEQSRPPVSLQAKVLDGLAYARAMLALHSVVVQDLRSKFKDHSDYQAWVQERYIEELNADAEIQAKLAALPDLLQRRDEINAKCAPIIKRLVEIEAHAWWESNFWEMRRRDYTPLVQKYGREALAALRPCDPVVSVHPDGVIFEVFSFDESSYGRVTVPMEKMDVLGDMTYGTTNVDFSIRLAEEFARVRSYRPAFLSVEAGGVGVSTSAGTQFEKKIDLPPSWIKGFLQVQSASSLPSTDVQLSASTVAEILSVLRRQREKVSPRSLRFKLVRGQKPIIVIEPWNLEIREPQHVFEGDDAQIRIWGRRRLFVLESLLPLADNISVRLLGDGMPHYWSVEQAGHRFDLGLSGWTKNDWSSAARFDVLASGAEASDAETEKAMATLEEWRMLTPEETAETLHLGREVATACLQRLCREGRAMFDGVKGVYRCRQLLPFAAPAGDEDGRLSHAKSLVEKGAAIIERVDELDEFLSRAAGEGATVYRAQVKAGPKDDRDFSPTVALNADGRVTFAQCTCSFFRREKLRKGPCAHILAATVLASRGVTSAAA